MGKIYDFSRLISKYSNDIEVIREQEGQYVNGRFVAGEAVVETIRGAIMPIKSEKIYQSGGTLTTSDRQLYTQISLEEDLKFGIRKKNLRLRKTRITATMRVSMYIC